jgi:ATP phosphoribosyltransferase
MYLGAIPEEGQHERDSRKILTRVGLKIKNLKFRLFIKIQKKFS